jgi:hypothetical protein
VSIFIKTKKTRITPSFCEGGSRGCTYPVLRKDL